MRTDATTCARFLQLTDLNDRRMAFGEDTSLCSRATKLERLHKQKRRLTDMKVGPVHRFDSSLCTKKKNMINVLAEATCPFCNFQFPTV